jgi:hypothetical protein
MRTPPPGSRVLFKTSKAGAPAVHPWGKAAVRVWSEKKGKPSDTPVRAASRAVSKELYPEGKALARIRYFEVQRGLTPAVLPGVHLARSKAKIARPAKRSVRSPYAAAFAAKWRIRQLARLARTGTDADPARTDVRQGAEFAAFRVGTLRGRRR